VENQNFPTPCILRPRWRGPPGIGYQRCGSKNRIMGLPGQERSLTISSAVWYQRDRRTDGRTDGHRATAKTALMLSVAQ